MTFVLYLGFPLYFREELTIFNGRLTRQKYLLVSEKMTGMKAATEETYIRMLPFSVVNYLARLLDIDKQWERLVVHIPKRLADLTKPQFEQRYSQLQVRIFDDKGKRSDGSSTRAIIGKHCVIVNN